jgi:hypothetical protein
MTGMVALVFVLGLKHGFDPDHLVAIDGMARSTRSRWCGLFFSLGHGVVVTLVGVAVALAATEWQAPAWLEHAGALISIGVLLTLGLGVGVRRGARIDVHARHGAHRCAQRPLGGADDDAGESPLDERRDRFAVPRSRPRQLGRACGAGASHQRRKLRRDSRRLRASIPFRI